MPHTLKPGDVLVALTNGAYNDGVRAINLRIEDESTGHFIIDVDLTGPELASLIGSRRVRTQGLLIQLQYLLRGEEVTAHLEIHRTDPVSPFFEVHVGGEQFAAILGNAVTRVSGARIANES